MWSYSYFSDTFHSANLIKLVKQQPVLWYPHHSNHNNKQVRNKAWENIAARIVKNWIHLPDKEKHGSVAEIKSKWKNIKDTFMKDQKLRRKANTGGRKKRKYVYTDILQFLNCSVNPENVLGEAGEVLNDQELTEQNRDTKPDVEAADLEEQNDSNLDLNELEDLDTPSFKNEFISSDCESSSDQPPAVTRNILFVDSTSTGTSDEYQVECRSRQSSSSGFVSSSCGSAGKKRSIDAVSRGDDGASGEDPDKMFLLSMLPLFKNLDEQDKIVARIELTQVLQKLLYPMKY